MELRTLEYFLVVARELNITAAAKAAESSFSPMKAIY